MQKIYEDFDCHLACKKLIKNNYFMYECLKCGNQSLFIADYFISNIPTMCEYWIKSS